ncbi:hypothetical protein AOLI_G00090700 [Acnodon oligacanthus]
MAVVKKAQQRLYFLRILRKNKLQEKLLVSYYRSTIESVLMYCASTWYSSCSVAERGQQHIHDLSKHPDQEQLKQHHRLRTTSESSNREHVSTSTCWHLS